MARQRDAAQINHILKPEFPAHRLLVVQASRRRATGRATHRTNTRVFLREVVLEEVYYSPQPGGATGAFGAQSLYSPEHGLDLTETVRRRHPARAAALVW